MKQLIVAVGVLVISGCTTHAEISVIHEFNTRNIPDQFASEAHYEIEGNSTLNAVVFTSTEDLTEVAREKDLFGVGFAVVPCGVDEYYRPLYQGFVHDNDIRWGLDEQEDLALDDRRIYVALIPSTFMLVARQRFQNHSEDFGPAEELVESNGFCLKVHSDGFARLTRLVSNQAVLTLR